MLEVNAYVRPHNFELKLGAISFVPIDHFSSESFLVFTVIFFIFSHPSHRFNFAFGIAGMASALATL